MAPLNPVRGFAGSRRQPVKNSPDSPIPLLSALRGTWSARAFWYAMHSYLAYDGMDADPESPINQLLGS